ncbi:diacylglycerol kinase [Tenuifilaceae bacterium CYCD]|nr:diacylglycerol kinase [Tenuifilaceae bacterium CYCD]
MNDSWFIVINPRAGGGKGSTDWPIIECLLAKYRINFTHEFTEHKYHAIEITVKAIKNGYRKIIAVGGDGTLNEVVNGIFIQKIITPSEITIGVIAVGTGNDWLRMYSTTHDYEECIRAIQSECVFKQDVGQVEFCESMVKHTRYFVNAAGIGFDAEVALQTNKLKDVGRRGTLLYMFSLLKSLIGYHHTKVNITVDSTEIQERILSLTIGIGCYNGAGMMQVPNAVVNDGLFDITIIKKISVLGVLRNIHRLYDGSILKHPKISSYRGKEIKITSNPPIKLEADGESLGESPFHFTILPEAINVVVSKTYNSKPKHETELIPSNIN